MTTLVRDQLETVFAVEGTPAATSANNPLPLVDPGAVWLVTRGHVDIVAMTIVLEEDGRSDLQRTHLLRIDEGELILGFRAPLAGHNVLLLGYGSADAQVSRLAVKQLAELTRTRVDPADVAARVDAWVAGVCELCSIDLPPAGTQNLRLDEPCRLESGQSAQPQRGVIWMQVDGGNARFLGNPQAAAVSNGVYFPVDKSAWITAEDACTIAPHRAADVITDEAYWAGVNLFQNTVETVVDIQRTRARDQSARRLVDKREATRSTLDAAFTDLGSVLARRTPTRTAADNENLLLTACQRIGEHLGVDIVDPGLDSIGDDRGQGNPLELIARINRLALRRVELTRGWHRRDNGPLLAFLDDGETPVALIPTSSTSYALHDFTTGRVQRVTRKVADSLSPSAFMFYRTLPDHPLTARDLVRFGIRGVWRDLFTILFIGGAGGLLALATPIAIGHVFDTVVPTAARTQLLHITIALVIAAFATCCFAVTRNIALIRTQHRAGNALQAAVWDRLINLPVRFFSKYSAGDLGLRAMGIDSIMETISTGTITGIIASLFSLLSMIIMFYYSPVVALIALGMALIGTVFIIGCGIAQLRHEKYIENAHGKLAAMLLQFMNGISKIRIAAAEDRAFAQWAGRFTDLTRRILKVRILGNYVSIFLAGFPVITYLFIFWLIAPPTESGPANPGAFAISTGGFLAFLAAYTSMLHGMLRLGHLTVQALNIIPIYERLQPILQATPEVDTAKHDPGRLRGRIECSNICFQYDKDGPPILTEVSFTADPGEFIALVGPSGSGKSTLLRILLGFETPEVGSISYDGFDASGLDQRALRKQIGVVLQEGQLLPGDIFSNIVGSAVDLTINDAWAAAELAGLADDIEAMPMGMHTVIGEGIASLSGGQRQRLMIARALVTRPRIVFFDEATSALDNPTQKIVTESLDRLRATRIVIAHRLSTIVNADRIFVLEAGRIVQRGSYEELVNQPGTFYDLVKRQMA